MGEAERIFYIIPLREIVGVKYYIVKYLIGNNRLKF